MRYEGGDLTLGALKSSGRYLEVVWLEVWMSKQYHSEQLANLSLQVARARRRPVKEWTLQPHEETALGSNWINDAVTGFC